MKPLQRILCFLLALLGWHCALVDWGLAPAPDFDTLQQMTDDAITANGGCGGHEIRTWIMAAAAAEALGIASYEVLHYRAIPEWVAGYGIMRTM